MTKLLDVPETVTIPVVIGDEVGGRKVITEVEQDFPFIVFLRQALHQYGKLGQGAANIRQSAQIHDKLDEYEGVWKDNLAKPMEWGPLDFKVIKEAVEAAKWKPQYAHKLVSYFDALDNAQDVKVPLEKVK